MSRFWKWFEISILFASIVAALVIVSAASAQSEQRNRDDDREAGRASSQDSNDSSRDERTDQRENDRRASARDGERDRDNRRGSEQYESRSRSNSRDRSQSSENRSEEQGGLGVAVDDDEQGVRVVRVYRDTPAQDMGLREGDRITYVDGHEIDSARDFISRIRDMEPGEEVELDIVRNRDERSLSGELKSRGEALRLRNQGGNREQASSSDRSERGGDALNRINALERRLDDLRRELQQVRSSLESRRSNRESSVIYDENQPRSNRERFSDRPSSRTLIRMITSGETAMLWTRSRALAV